MHIVDWIVCFSILVLIVLYGLWKTRNINDATSYLLGNRELKWYTIGLSVMATQASAITFLSTPGQAYDDGMRFAQFYFGLPLAMVILSIFVLPIFYKSKVFTAYQFLENRFDVKTRTLTSLLFLLQRGMAAGLTIFAPAIILSSILGWNLNITNILIGVLVIVYTVTGGSEAVSQTQKQQMIVILSGMGVAFFVILYKLSPDLSLSESVQVAGAMGKMNIVDFKFDLSNKYNIWTGLLGGTFLFLSYFGTDQSQVQRYISGKSLTESRLGLMFNGLFKVPMQVMILFTGIMVFMFFQFNPSPLHFNQANVDVIRTSELAEDYNQLELDLKDVYLDKQAAIQAFVSDPSSEEKTNTMNSLLQQEKEIRTEARTLIASYDGEYGALDQEDTDYVFINFIMNHLPIGLIGLLLAVIFSAAMSSTASELNALATTTVVDIYKRSFRREEDDHHYLVSAKVFTLIWGIIALVFATLASLFENLIEAVNMIGSLFYGVILGIFAVAFFFKWIKGKAVFIGAIIAELFIIALFIMDKLEIINLAYLWLNPIGCFLVIIIAGLLQKGLKMRFFPELWKVRSWMTDEWGGEYGRVREPISDFGSTSFMHLVCQVHKSKINHAISIAFQKGHFAT